VFYDTGDEIPVLTNIAVIGTKGEDTELFKPGSQSFPSNEPQIQPDNEEAPKVIEFEIESSPGGRLRISPLARNMAETLGVDIYLVHGTGPQGRIIARDVELAAAKAPVKVKPADKPESPRMVVTESKPVSTAAPQVLQQGDDFELRTIPNIRKLIASAMHRSLQNSAQLTHHLSADARQLQRLRRKFKKELEEGKITENITINDLVCYAVVRALKKFPQANTHYLGDKMRWFKKVHLGLAVDTERGLMVPALKNADDYSVAGLSSQLKRLSAEARSGNINPDLLSPEAATFTVSNLGNYGVEMFTPVINLPQTAILGVCAIVPRPKETEEGVYAFVPMIGLSLTYDHQALDGGEATLFLAEIRNQIEKI
jgi:pyruvate dehydrogenase E2 component (dihydrolipoamide acetyltransferase)